MNSPARHSASFAGQIVLVVGGGAGLGRQYALDLASAGAGVVVAGRGDSVLDTVAAIREAGGLAAPVIADARDGQAIVQAALAVYGRIDGMVLNAGIVRDRTFLKMTRQDWDEVIGVHLGSAFACTQAVWPHLLEQRSGSIVMTTSGAGFHGNFGQANYAAAKGAIIALAKSLAIEGRTRGVRVNAVAPMAATGMTAGIFAPAVADALKAEWVSPYVLALLHPANAATGLVIEAGGGWAGAMRWERARGVRYTGADALDHVLAHWPEVADFTTGADHPQTTTDSLAAGTGAVPARDQRP